MRAEEDQYSVVSNEKSEDSSDEAYDDLFSGFLEKLEMTFEMKVEEGFFFFLGR